MGKFFIFSLIWWLTGSPIIAIIVILAILYAVDRRYVGLLPNLAQPIMLSRRLAKHRRHLQLSPHDTSIKVDAARILIRQKRYREALALLSEAYPVMRDSADVSAEIGLCHLKIGEIDLGEQAIRRALELNARVKYGEPYLWLGEACSTTDPVKALSYMEKFNSIQSSSCEAYYRIGRLYAKLDRKTDASRAYRECLQVYRLLPRYKRRSERRWAALAWFRSSGG